MATLGTIKVPIYTKIDGEYQLIGSIEIDVNGKLSGDTISLSVGDLHVQD